MKNKGFILDKIFILLLLLLYSFNSSADLLNDTLKKSNLLREKGVELLVWEDRLTQTNMLAKNLLELSDIELERISSIDGIRIVAARVRGHLYQSSTNILYLQHEIDINKAYEALGLSFDEQKDLSRSSSNLTTEQNVKRGEEIDNNFDKLIHIYRFRGIKGEEKLFRVLTTISEDELPMLYDGSVTVIIPTRDRRIRKIANSLLIHTGSEKNTILQELN